MKKIFLLISSLYTFIAAAQQIYCDHEGLKVMHYGWYDGMLDSMTVNPDPDGVNMSANCTKYIRDTALYDNIRIYPNNKLIDVSPYDFNSFSTPKIKMKLYSSAPVGTGIVLQLGTKLDNTYPSGVHSEFYAATNMQNAWQQVTFAFTGIPPGSMVSASDVDKLVLLFHPNSNARDTIYIDDLTGPNLLTSGIEKRDALSMRLMQNSPNPARGKTNFNFQIVEPGHVSLKIYDIVGNLIETIVDEQLKPGSYVIPLDTSTIPDGIYFYTLESGDIKRSMKMIVAD